MRACMSKWCFMRWLLLAGILGLAGCETTQVASFQPAKGLQLETDEARLWTRSNEEQEHLDASGFRLSDAPTDAYLARIIERLNSDNGAGGIHFEVKVLKDPTLNAFAFPNGVIYVHTGLLARLENEAQLATVLAHECSHVYLRHALKGMRDLKNKTAVYAGVGAVTVGFGLSGLVVNILGGIGTMAAVSGYSRDLEREADRLGFQRYLEAGYDPAECTAVFRILLEESRKSKNREPFFFGSHPRLQERIESFHELGADARAGDARRKEAAAFTAMLPPILTADCRAALQAGNIEAALADAERLLALMPDSVESHTLKGEAHRKRSTDGDLPKAMASYRTAIALREGSPDAQRGLGLACLKAGDKASAKQALSRYLELSPTAPDRAHMEALLKQCEP